ncbi:hypothetical protein GCM10028827_28050 [Mucilaginibacter myungsuensis]
MASVIAGVAMAASSRAMVTIFNFFIFYKFYVELMYNLLVSKMFADQFDSPKHILFKFAP